MLKCAVPHHRRTRCFTRSSASSHPIHRRRKRQRTSRRLGSFGGRCTRPAAPPQRRQRGSGEKRALTARCGKVPRIATWKKASGSDVRQARQRRCESDDAAALHGTSWQHAAERGTIQQCGGGHLAAAPDRPSGAAAKATTRQRGKVHTDSAMRKGRCAAMWRRACGSGKKGSGK